MSWVSGGARLGVVALAVPLMGIAQVVGPIEIGPSWGRAGSDGRSAALYTTVVNRGVLPDRLNAVSCPGFGNTSLADLDPSSQGSGPTDHGVLAPRGGRAVLGPEGAHVELTDLPHALPDGTLVGCTLHFVRSGERLVVFTIGAPGNPVDEP